VAIRKATAWSQDVGGRLGAGGLFGESGGTIFLYPVGEAPWPSRVFGVNLSPPRKIKWGPAFPNPWARGPLGREVPLSNPTVCGPGWMAPEIFPFRFMPFTKSATEKPSMNGEKMARDEQPIPATQKSNLEVLPTKERGRPFPLLPASGANYPPGHDPRRSAPLGLQFPVTAP